MIKKASLTALALLCGTALASGCGKTETKPAGEGQPPVDNTPVTLTLFAHDILRDQDFIDYIQEPIRQKYPHITIKKVDADKQVTMANLLATQDIPDFIWVGLTNIQKLTELSVPTDLEPMTAKHKFDLSRLEPTMVKSIRSYTKEGTLNYLPFRSYAFGLHYNKTIFDKFGAAYPQNGMTWDQAIELARKVTRNENGVAYRGLSAGTLLNRMQTQLAVPYVDVATDKPLVATNENWRKLFQVFQDIYGIPGNYPEGATFGDGARAFLETKTLAMFPQLLLLNNLDLAKATTEGFQWGVVSYPTFADKPNAGPGIFSDGFVIPNGSKHPDAAFQVIAHLLSDEVQTMSSKRGNMTALADTAIKNKLHEDNPLSKGIDMAALLKVGSAEPHAKTIYDDRARLIVTKHLESFFTGKTDMNTARRLSDEEIAKAVAEAKAAGK